MSRFIEDENRHQATLLPELLNDYIAEDNTVRVIDMFADDLDLSGLGFETVAASTGRPGYHPATLLKHYIYGYFNRIQSSRRLEREAQRNVELMWLMGRLGKSRPFIPVINSRLLVRLDAIWWSSFMRFRTRLVGVYYISPSKACQGLITAKRVASGLFF